MNSSEGVGNIATKHPAGSAGGGLGENIAGIQYIPDQLGSHFPAFLVKDSEFLPISSNYHFFPKK